MKIDTKLIQQLREKTGAGIMDVKEALAEFNGDVDKAIESLRKKGQKIAATKQDRQTKEGLIGCYVHANGKIAALVAVACETDFVAQTDDFKNLVHDLAMQVAATNPLYLSPNEVPVEVVKKEKEIYLEQLKKEGKPEKVLDKIVDGKLAKYYQGVCFLKQLFIKDDKKSIEQLLQEVIAKLGENIQIKEFKRLNL